MKKTDKLVRCDCGEVVRESARATHWIIAHLHKAYQAVRVTSVLEEG